MTNKELLLIKQLSETNIIYVKIFGKIEPYYENSDRQWYEIDYKNKLIQFNFFDERNGSGFNLSFDKYGIDFSINENF